MNGEFNQGAVWNALVILQVCDTDSKILTVLLVKNLDAFLGNDHSPGLPLDPRFIPEGDSFFPSYPIVLNHAK